MTMRLLVAMGFGLALFVSASPRKPVIIQTNAAGDNIHVIDPARTGSLVRSKASKSITVQQLLSNGQPLRTV
jgi:hypothetical protein